MPNEYMASHAPQSTPARLIPVHAYTAKQYEGEKTRPLPDIEAKRRTQNRKGVKVFEGSI